MGGMKALLGDTPYPLRPGFKEQGGASEAAACAVVDTAKILREQCLAAIKASPKTADEVAAYLGQHILSIRPRLSELRKLELIKPTDYRHRNASGKSATVWRAA